MESELDSQSSFVGSVDEGIGASFLWRPTTATTLNQVTFQRLWERRLAMISSAWWTLTSSKFFKDKSHYSIRINIFQVGVDQQYNASVVFSLIEYKFRNQPLDLDILPCSFGRTVFRQPNFSFGNTSINFKTTLI